MPVFKDYVHCYLLSCDETLKQLRDFNAHLEKKDASLYQRGENQGIVSMMERMINIFEESLKRPSAVTGPSVDYPKKTANLFIQGMLYTAKTVQNETSFSKVIEDIESLARVKQNLLKELFNKESPMPPLEEPDYIEGVRAGIRFALHEILPQLASNYEGRYNVARNPYWEEAETVEPFMTKFLG